MKLPSSLAGAEMSSLDPSHPVDAGRRSVLAAGQAKEGGDRCRRKGRTAFVVHITVAASAPLRPKGHALGLVLVRGLSDGAHLSQGSLAPDRPVLRTQQVAGAGTASGGRA